MPRALLPLLLVCGASAFVGPAVRVGPPRTSRVIASAKIIPAVNVGLGAALLGRAVSAGSGVDTAVLASTGLLATLNLAVTDNARYASAKRAIAKVENPELPLAKLAARWYTVVRVQVFGQFVGLVWAARSGSPAGVLCGCAAFMAANVAFFVLGAGVAKHDELGLPSPMPLKLQKFVLTTDIVLFAAAAGAALLPAGSIGRAALASLFSAGCLIGALEGAPKTAGALKALTGLA